MCGLKVPVDGEGLAGFFSRNVKIKEVIIPNQHKGECFFVIF